MSYDNAEKSHFVAEDAAKSLPETPVESMATTALMAEFVSYLGPDSKERTALLDGWKGVDRSAAFKARRNAVAQEIDRRIPMGV
jgi:hypothetical protein